MNKVITEYNKGVKHSALNISIPLISFWFHRQHVTAPDYIKTLKMCYYKHRFSENFGELLGYDWLSASFCSWLLGCPLVCRVCRWSGRRTSTVKLTLLAWKML